MSGTRAGCLPTAHDLIRSRGFAQGASPLIDQAEEEPPGRYQAVAQTSHIAQGKCLRVELDGRELLICHTAEGFFAVDNICSHSHARLDEGRLRGSRIFCPLHGASFDVRDGRALSRPAHRPIRSHPLRIEGEDILVDVDGSSPAG
jgi:3-phenylpropionate/trans-cinnamate dioxygenase ferredoxin subunit